MEITSFDLFEVPPRWLFLKVTASDGTTGWGEPVVEGHTRAVRAAVEEYMESVVLGEDPLAIEDHWQAMYRSGFYRGGPVLMSAIAGIDQALWDIKGKELGKPVYELLGGAARERIRVYQWAGGDRPDEIAAEARDLVDNGYTAVKMDASEPLEHIDSPSVVDRIVDRVETVRDAVGPEVDVAVDFRGRASKSMTRRLLDALESHRLLFVEEPVLPEHGHLLGDVARETVTPVATGERLYTRWDYRPLFEENAVDVVQPNVSHAGGISEVVNIARMAETYDVAVSPNCPIGPIALAASLQVAAHVPNFLIQDHGSETHETADTYEYVANTDAFDFEDGYLDLPSDPGLGVAIDEEQVRDLASRESVWEYPVWRLNDGSVTDW
ncbi:galactonate dehydratase [Halosimplex marinum]|uniref:galactonate dehydratase n=1 Tax=Halosimplex marinum TaxID=3396620 RepID=UPI003F550509